MQPLISPQVNEVLQIIILVLLVGSLWLKRQKKFYWHGMVLFVAVVLNLVSFGLIMLPSLLMMQITLAGPLAAVFILAIVHGAAGLIAIVLGLWLMASWHLQSSVKNCFKNKRLMRSTIVLWLFVLLLGFLLYYFLYA